MCVDRYRYFSCINYNHVTAAMCECCEVCCISHSNGISCMWLDVALCLCVCVYYAWVCGIVYFHCLVWNRIIYEGSDNHFTHNRRWSVDCDILSPFASLGLWFLIEIIDNTLNVINILLDEIPGLNLLQNKIAWNWASLLRKWSGTFLFVKLYDDIEVFFRPT